MSDETKQAIAEMMIVQLEAEKQAICLWEDNSKWRTKGIKICNAKIEALKGNYYLNEN